VLFAHRDWPHFELPVDRDGRQPQGWSGHFSVGVVNDQLKRFGWLDKSLQVVRIAFLSISVMVMPDRKRIVGA
jgi:hypothetical protein